MNMAVKSLQSGRGNTRSGRMKEESADRTLPRLRAGGNPRPRLKWCPAPAGELNFGTSFPEPHNTRLFGDERAAKMYIWFTVLAGLALVSFSFLKTCFPHLHEDCAYILTSLKLCLRLIKYKKSKPFYSVLDHFLDAVKKHPSKILLHFEGREYTYGEVDRQSNKVARALRAEARLKEGDTVALFLTNEPCFMWTWVGVAKLGCSAALLNVNIRSKSLLHCFSCCAAKVIVASKGERANKRVRTRIRGAEALCASPVPSLKLLRMQSTSRSCSCLQFSHESIVFLGGPCAVLGCFYSMMFILHFGHI